MNEKYVLCALVFFESKMMIQIKTLGYNSFVDMLPKLLTLALTWRLFGLVGEKQTKTAYLGSPVRNLPMHFSE